MPPPAEVAAVKAPKARERRGARDNGERNRERIKGANLWTRGIRKLTTGPLPSPQGHCAPSLHTSQVRVLSTFHRTHPVAGLTFFFSLETHRTGCVPGPKVACYTHGCGLWQWPPEDGAHLTEGEAEVQRMGGWLRTPAAETCAARGWGRTGRAWSGWAGRETGPSSGASQGCGPSGGKVRTEGRRENSWDGGQGVAGAGVSQRQDKGWGLGYLPISGLGEEPDHRLGALGQGQGSRRRGLLTRVRLRMNRSSTSWRTWSWFLSRNLCTCKGATAQGEEQGVTCPSVSVCLLPSSSLPLYWGSGLTAPR